MKIRTLIPAAAAAVLGLAAGASAQTAPSTQTYGAGVAAANDRGAVAGGMVGSQAQAAQERRDDRRNRRDRRNNEAQAVQPNASSTYGTGAVYTDRNSTSAAVTSGGTASGTGVNSTSSTVDAYGETTRNGTSADIYGNSTATSGQTPRTPRTPR